MVTNLRDGSSARAQALGSVLAVTFAAFGSRGCAMHPGFERLANGDLHVACNGPLANCLVPVAERCAEHGFDVVTASEHRETTGSPPEQQEILRSDATVRCRKAVPLLGHDPNKPAAPTVVVVSASAAPAGPPRCVPGSSQGCAMTSGCSGAQVCAVDGTHFGPCECAPAAASSASAAAADGGAP
jgi:hypothetical protein